MVICGLWGFFEGEVTTPQVPFEGTAARSRPARAPGRTAPVVSLSCFGESPSKTWSHLPSSDLQIKGDHLLGPLLKMGTQKGKTKRSDQVDSL